MTQRLYQFALHMTTQNINKFHFLVFLDYPLSMSMYNNTLALLEDEVVYHFFENIV